MKIEYRRLAGGVSTAYIDERDGDVATGTDKYTDDPVRVVWSGAAWVEEDEEGISHG